MREADEVVEPLGLLGGPAARLAIEAGLARPLAGGPLAFTMVRPRGEGAVPVTNWPGPLDQLTAPRPRWADLPPGPHVMGILNVTPDSFSDGGPLLDVGRAVAAGQQMLRDGAAILDVGGESTRPGADKVPPDEEQRRILPIIAALVREGARISVDTRNSATMARALDAGAAIINDVSALQHDPAAAPLVAARRCPVILMHMRGDPRTMRDLASYDDVAFDVLAELTQRVALAEAAGINRAQIAVDPGFGFAKKPHHSRELLQHLSLLCHLGCPIVAGLSRKSFVAAMAAGRPPQALDAASLAGGLAALAQGADILRVHDVPGTVQAVEVWQTLML